ncbi:hypothetical protein KUTeg_008790 [Tegillarca granosa]|uniref:Sulfotransferase domain-containing protein n=1 Tax=Tegillarca granosa TaxID=220873 RepID=A0ABQ9FA33_TEGGR|nr:hypothetical protein KUTeg_008790 [Tegillarca granosa]
MVLKKSTEFAPLFAFAENFTKEGLEKLQNPRVICTHLPLRFLPPKVIGTAKIICVFRNPKDVAVSLHNYIRHINFIDYKASWNDYLTLFVNGDVPCGNWFDHNLLENVSKVADFLGVKLGPELTTEITNKCDFKIQYEERTTNVHEIIARLTKDTPNFLYRKGEVGEWKNWFTVAQSEEFDKMYHERMKNSNLNLRFS